MRKITVFGSTGSIGKSALEVIRGDRKSFCVDGLLVHSNITLLLKQVREFKPRRVCVVDERAAGVCRRKLPRGVKLFSGAAGLQEFSSLATDIAIMGIVGLPSLPPLLTALKHARRVALASKEAIVVAGELIQRRAKRYGVRVIPVDSEINALFQLSLFMRAQELQKVYLTASGGALFRYPKSRLHKVTKHEVLAHPTWRMGKRITVDSATLVNKGFEVMETHHLFGLDYSAIDIVIHRQSFVHAFVQTKDGMSFACMYPPSMKVPIAHALYYPCRKMSPAAKPFFGRLDMSFEPLRYKDFPLLRLVIAAARRGGNFPVIVNAADEVAIEYFLDGRISFYDIRRVVEHVFSKVSQAPADSVEKIYFWDAWARHKAEKFLDKRCS